MSNKYHCDICDVILSDDKKLPPQIEHRGRKFVVSTPGSDICKYCLFDATSKYDNRPKEA